MKRNSFFLLVYLLLTVSSLHCMKPKEEVSDLLRRFMVMTAEMRKEESKNNFNGAAVVENRSSGEYETVMNPMGNDPMIPRKATVSQSGRVDQDIHSKPRLSPMPKTIRKTDGTIEIEADGKVVIKERF